MIKVLVADDHPAVRDGLRALFAEYPSIDLIGEAATGREAIKAAVIGKPDVIIMDLAMSDTDGLSATAEISRVDPAGRNGCRGRPGELRTRRRAAGAGPTERDVHRRKSISSADPA
jgi:CheY-like chemotaxis protein